MRLPAGAIHHQCAVRSPPTPGTAPTEKNPAVCVLRRRPEGVRLGRPRTVMEGDGPAGVPSVIIDVIRQLHDGMRARVRMDDEELSE